MRLEFWAAYGIAVQIAECKYRHSMKHLKLVMCMTDDVCTVVKQYDTEFILGVCYAAALRIMARVLINEN